ncbi:hypothetical protein HW130_18620 [Streptomyces sp. PKU-EA00015]|uniref:DUF7439 family protein n=1 Tax=Streptomyces sp. PKU-EA00015 TaxID=2748326 RepID=UPI0015A445B8|nr:hypothetical protein [Streptomyces sp. PKU-EA00015]NWF28258.1 hypothetical protein [Streptomyces sp. PKU-EA00015]
MSKHRRPASVLVSVLPVRYRSRVAAVLSAVGVIVSIAAVVYADKPEVALIVQIATSLGLVDGSDSEETE